ncbi:hypothetical protein HanIR_Chr15g0759061 [Helianthus annuus]|nr:hypothetical protein HanIR_Chr15g0759061 [Helianthus annuus]
MPFNNQNAIQTPHTSNKTLLTKQCNSRTTIDPKVKVKIETLTHLNNSLFKPISNFIFLHFPKCTRLLNLRIHHINIIPQHTFTTIRGSVKLLIRSSDLFFSLLRALVERRRSNEVVGLFRRVKGGDFIWVNVVEECGVNVGCLGFD